MRNHRPLLSQNHAFVVRIWWEPGLTGPNRRALWRGQVQHVSSDRTLAFQSLEQLLQFIQRQTGDLQGSECTHQ